MTRKRSSGRPNTLPAKNIRTPAAAAAAENRIHSRRKPHSGPRHTRYAAGTVPQTVAHIRQTGKLPAKRRTRIRSGQEGQGGRGRFRNRAP